MRVYVGYYAPNAVNHMMRGKAVSRAFRGHMLVDSALHALIMAHQFGIDLPLPELDLKV